MKFVAVFLTMSLFLFCGHDHSSPVTPEKKEKKPVSSTASINHFCGKGADLNKSGNFCRNVANEDSDSVVE